jgi:hypothetical protein
VFVKRASVMLSEQCLLREQEDWLGITYVDRLRLSWVMLKSYHLYLSSGAHPMAIQLLKNN